MTGKTACRDKQGVAAVVLRCCVAVFGLVSGAGAIAVPRDLPLPSGEPDAEAIIEQVYFVNHAYAFRNVTIGKKGKKVTTMVSGMPDGPLSVQTLVRYLNNAYDDGVYSSKDMIIFKSGKIKGTGYLISHYADENKTPSYIMWMPELRKIRRFAAPAQDDVCCGANLTYGDLFMRRPGDEEHELLGVEEFEGCLGMMEIPREKRTKYIRNIPERQCGHDGKKVYKVKSTTKFPKWWYDYRISYVDVNTYADYRILYYKDGEEIKIFEKDWEGLGLDDIRAQRLNYWYVRTYKTNSESIIVVPPEVISWNDDIPDTYWAEKTLRKIRR